MATRAAAEQRQEVARLRQRLMTLRHSIHELEDVLDRYIDAEQSLRQSEEQFRLLVAGVRDYAIFMLDATGHVATWNAGAEGIKGYTADEIVGQHFSVFYPPEDVAGGKTERALRVASEDGVFRDEGWRKRKDGTPFWAGVVITSLYDEDGVLRGFAKVTRDLSERRAAEEAQRQLAEQELRLTREQIARAEAEANIRLRDEFLGSTAHELRTPVTAVLGYAQLLQRRLERLDGAPERLAQPVRAIVDQARRLDRLTTMLLDIARLEHGRLEIQRAPFDLGRGVARVAEELQLITERHTVVADTVAEAGPPLVVEGDELRIEQVVYNLVQNAIKYSPAGGVITVAARRDGGQAVVEVSDQGMGIAPEDLPHIFDRFYRAASSSQEIGGLGLGLFLVRQFVALHGGTVDVESALGRGTTFRVTLPLLGA